MPSIRKSKVQPLFSIHISITTNGSRAHTSSDENTHIDLSHPGTSPRARRNINGKSNPIDQRTQLHMKWNIQILYTRPWKALTRLFLLILRFRLSLSLWTTCLMRWKFALSKYKAVFASIDIIFHVTYWAVQHSCACLGYTFSRDYDTFRASIGNWMIDCASSEKFWLVCVYLFTWIYCMIMRWLFFMFLGAVEVLGLMMTLLGLMGVRWWILMRVCTIFGEYCGLWLG